MEESPITCRISVSRRRWNTCPSTPNDGGSRRPLSHRPQDILETFFDRRQSRQLGERTRLPNGKRIPGLKLDHPRQLALMHALVRFAH